NFDGDDRNAPHPDFRCTNRFCALRNARYAKVFHARYTESLPDVENLGIRNRVRARGFAISRVLRSETRAARPFGREGLSGGKGGFEGGRCFDLNRRPAGRYTTRCHWLPENAAPAEY